MATRIDLELTSSRDDGHWTWRAAGAKQPKGVVASDLVPNGAKVGDVFKADADYMVDGIEITQVHAPKGPRAKAETLEILGSGREEQLVTSKLYKGKKGRDSRGGRRDRGDSFDRGGGRGGGDRGGGGGGDRGGRGGGDRGGRGGGNRGRREQAPRLRPANVHRSAWLDSLPEEHRLIGEQLLDGGMPGIRASLENQNAKARAEGNPEVPTGPLLNLAENMVSNMQAAEWRDRADAAIAGADKVDIRDLRSVVVAAETGARDDESRAKATELRHKIKARQDREQAAWLRELESAIGEGRIVRALRSSARPVKAGTPMPAELAEKLLNATNEALSEDEEPSRWASVVDAVAFSPIREFVTPAGVPDKEDREIVDTVTKLSNRIPQIATMLGIEPRTDRRGGGRGRGRGKGGNKSGGKGPDKTGGDKGPDNKGGHKGPDKTGGDKGPDNKGGDKGPDNKGDNKSPVSKSPDNKSDAKTSAPKAEPTAPAVDESAESAPATTPLVETPAEAAASAPEAVPTEVAPAAEAAATETAPAAEAAPAAPAEAAEAAPETPGG